MSKHKILIINSAPDPNRLLIDLISSLKERGYYFYLFDCRVNSPLAPCFQETKKIYVGPEPLTFFSSFLFILFLPWLWLINFRKIIRAKFRQKIKTIVCLDIREKIIFTPLARLIGLRVISWECPGQARKKYRRGLWFIFKIMSRGATLLVFNNFSKIYLINRGLKENNITIIRPWLKNNEPRFQENIFSNLAQADQPVFRKKFFTIGTICDLNKDQTIETLFQAAAKILSVVPQIQIIIVGDGEERKNLSWLAGKLGLNNLVWFVGEQKRWRKWLDSFDIFVINVNAPTTNDLLIALKAKAAGLPVVAPRHFGWEEIIDDNKNGVLLPAGDSEALAKKIISLSQDKRQRLWLGQNARQQAEENFRLEKIITNIEKIL